ncbi:uncharacterized protein PRCAT00005386001 [Priceomyces carsonii]|uniref:uncharacterized protein n=1 Tax=Priceomyces carsonii TaxID=28549 RepID=UPI002ED7EE60|nr:unnamed protein product [Priceomyces carsonii]
MAQRDLTFNAPHSGEEEGLDNPFVAPGEDESSSFGSNQQSFSQLEEGAQYDRPYNEYNGYYSSQNGTTSNLLSHNNSSSSDDQTHNLLSANTPPQTSIQAPPEYDRYPSMAGSRVVSSSSLSSHFHQQKAPQKSSDEDDSASSNKSSNPFLHTADFSPFGGYPASSFPLHIDEKEQDDYLHNPDPIRDAEYDKNRFIYDLKNMDKRSMGGFLGVIFLLVAAVMVFIILPVLTYSGITHHYVPQTYEVLTHYKYPILSAIRTSLIDPDTPPSEYTRKNKNGDEWKLVFSDEFDAEGRTFYEGDDQFFTAVDLNYGATHDLEWYDPDAATTEKGTLNLRMDAYKNHDLFYRSAMVQSWNKMCFTQGILEISARLPHYFNVSGLWPGLWTMGNLGRPGYLASTDGVWPYTYEACDAGITPNQSSPDGISYLPGQRLNSCTCPGEKHPNPGTGRGAPEIDILEGEIDADMRGVASQSMQIAPFDIWYYPDYNFVEIHNHSVTNINTYTGGPFQQAVSGVTVLNSDWYEKGGNENGYQSYAYEYLNDKDDGYVTWYVGENPTLTVHSYALAPNGNIDWRYISKEPMAVVMNLGISNNWAYINWPALNFPATMSVDYVRVYQPKDSINIGCDPDDYPTSDYIEEHPNLYANVNLTSYVDGGYSYPKNKLVHGC